MARLELKNTSLVLFSVLTCMVSSEAIATGTEASEAPELKAEKPANGKLTLAYNKPSEAFMPIFQNISEGHVLAAFVDYTNGILLLPKDLPVIFAECGQVNAFYKSATGDITICYELLRYMAQSLLQLKKENAERGVEYDADAALTDAITFVFFHELGHALVDLYDVGIAGGREEDAVDGLATALLLDLDGGFVAAIHGAQAFLWMSKENEKDIQSLAFWDEHSFGSQRFFNIVCWVYGKMGGSEIKAALMRQGMQESRLSKCASEFHRLRKSWKDPPKPWLKPDKSDANPEAAPRANFSKKSTARQVKTARIQVNEIMQKAQQYMMDNNNECPKSMDDLVAQKYMRRKQQKDPWNRDFILRCPGKINTDGIDVISVGADGTEGTADDINATE